MQETQDRVTIAWLDYARYLGMYLVIWCHVFQGLPRQSSSLIILAHVIYLFHMPLFFIISGFLYKPTNSNFLTGILRLLLPYFLYQLIYLPIAYTRFLNTDNNDVFLN
jgi:fucose 4-O-acetylase-like acetyltransferase